jgi:hypothetical protein
MVNENTGPKLVKGEPVDPYSVQALHNSIRVVEDSSHFVRSISPTHMEKIKPDYFDCAFIHQTLSVCGAINHSLDSVKNEVTKTLRLRTPLISDEKKRFSSRDFSSNLQSPEKNQNQGFWKRYSGQKMDSKNQRLALNFEASNSCGQIHYLRDDSLIPVICMIFFCQGSFRHFNDSE